MVIQCKSCKTKYRFDETLITGDGIWVRCSRCQNVFFQQSLPVIETEADTAKKWDDVSPVPAREVPDLEEVPQDEIGEDALPALRKKSSPRLHEID